jgi:hypothetical protein
VLTAMRQAKAAEQIYKAVRAQHATQQSCPPGYRQQQIALRAGRREVLLAPHQQLPRCPTVRLA